MPLQTIDCAWLLADPGTAPAEANVRIVVDGGLIAALQPLPAPPQGPRRLALPALVNAHDHGRSSRTATIGAFCRPLEAWLPYAGVVPGVDPYLCAATSFARSVRRGVGRLMVHYTRVQGVGSYVDEVQAVCRAARDVGVQIGFAVAMRDRHGIAYADDATVLAALRPGIRDAVAARLATRPVAPAQQLALVDAVAQMVREADGGSLVPHATVQYGPTAVQWCSPALLQAIAEASAGNGRPVHMHLLETKYQRAWADAVHPEGIVAYLDGIGLLSPRLTLAHCAWARPDELALLAARGVTIAVNTSSNLALKSGIAPVPEMLRQGCRLAMGLDGSALDEDDDALREMRLGYLLHRGWGFDETLTRAQLWAFAARHGRHSVQGAQPTGAPAGGRIAVGEPADLLLLDWDALDDEDALVPGIDPLDLLLARGNASHIDSVIVGGRSVVQGGRVITVDEPALRTALNDEARKAMAAQGGSHAWRETLDALSADLAPFYQRGLHCGCC
ncbi:MAG: hydrolase [Rhodoferax sp.]|nr:hydrolase [Rhodoferax sp.]